MQLDRWGSFSHDRSRFYAAELVEGIEALHAASVIHRNLKPEHILIDNDGHIVLCGFGKSKAFQRGIAQSVPSGNPSTEGAPYWMKGSEELVSSLQPDCADKTSSLCGTATYFAPEVVMGLPYSYEIDWWSLGTILYEMLTGFVSSSITILPHKNSSTSWSFLRQRPFEADNDSDMYDRILKDELQFPEDQLIDRHTKDFIQGVSHRPVLT
jgi:serum/glucocorticoid-regulated kinase 2